MTDDRLDRIERQLSSLSHNVGIVIQQQRLILEALHLDQRISAALDQRLAHTEPAPAPEPA